MATTQLKPNSPRFSLKFRVVSDGLESAKAQALNRAGVHAHGGSFPLFPNLPPELRLKIWEYLIAPRIVAIACLDAEAPPPSEEPEEPWTSFPSLSQSPTDPPPATIPVLLLINRETRSLALKHYEPAFSWKVPHVLLSSTHSITPFQPFTSPPSLSSPSPSSSSRLPHSSSSSNPNPNPNSSPGSTWSPPSAWFNFALDAVYLLGELEPCDSFGFNSPTAYFLSREEALRVRRLAVAFAALGYGESGPQHIFGALFHVVDRFAGVVSGDGGGGGKVLVAVAPRDELTHALVGGEGVLVRDGDGDGDGRRGEEVNVVQKIWRDWYRGSIVTSSLANVQFELVREPDLPEHIAKPIRPVRSDL
ncbi:uncharacterized protein F4807DRAFT_466977 [Annulohypoxylon truncatum]|uniref:uncharacterized protein n=1 Tax=Annulohypoxylon truncatum TaxID=327061 RepID=UPI0020083242|nr:uncharacterized protein F4807DRAFT_466977 [Annulohypoxylon truncatum]KAI1210639.1 hypothetical protein F4807DRAFT_466977 [Annulohypoxylon truncatum]